ncbi:hypothetical protein F5144DRAFT_360698 [Chaetomium tenue]|uniref:Uncharacterized protein n=1 Tax=Chaetomium tenue TaxID=1854479 RepID=A0ACB7NZ01_9PEZI|nr:hypothetical protein F5144DRAFT_360698 [Chaetomium globosum]
MPSFTSRHYTPDRFRPLSKPEDDLMEDIHQTAPGIKYSSSGSLTLGPSDGSLLDYFDLPSPPSTPHRATHHHNNTNLSYTSLNSFPSPATSPGLAARSPATLSRSSSTSSSRNTTPTSSPPTSALPRWPSAAQRIHRLPTRPRSRSTSSASSAGSASTSSSLSAPALGDIEMGGMGGVGGGMMAPPPMIRSARRTPYYPPNASRNADRARVYMNRGPHYVPNWTPLSSLPRHVQLQIEERMTRFTAM